MKKLIQILTITSILQCGFSSYAAEPQAKPITASELLSAMGGYSYLVQLPKSIGDGSYISVQFRNHKGLGKIITGRTLAKGLDGELVRVTLLRQQGSSDEYKCTLTSKNFSMNGGDVKIPGGITYKSPNKIYSVNSSLLTFHESGDVTTFGIPNEAHIDIVVSLTASK